MSDYINIFLGLFSGLALFLFGMEFMGDGLENAAGSKLKSFFDKAITNPLKGALVGTIVTAIIQSSSATTVMVVGFVNAGLMSLYQAVGVIMGANIGTTITGQLITFKIDDYIPLFIIIGAALILFMKQQNRKEIGKIIFGFGLLFMGLTAMKDAMSPIAQTTFFQDLIIALEGNMFLGILVGAVMTAVVQSSSASTAILLSLAATGAISLQVAIPILFGNNIGTCVTALLSSLNANKVAKKAAFIHLSFNLIGTLIFLPLIGILSNIVTHMGGDIDKQIANAHTIFNVVNAIILLPFAGVFVKLANLALKDKEGEQASINRLDRRFLETPAIAFEQAFQESLTMYDLAKENLTLATNALMDGKTTDYRKIYENESEINRMERDLSSFLVSISSHDITEVDTNRIASMIKIVSDIERIGDHSKNIAELAEEVATSKLSFTSDAIEELKLMYNYTLESINSSYASYKNNNRQKANDTVIFEENIDRLEELLRDKHIKRLSENKCNAHSGAVFLDAISNFERIGDHSINIAEYILNLSDNSIK
ncbi:MULTISPECIES: Na/Pi cotransporter family protein [Turicibacter]|uniref:Sodium-dependent phosphate transporter n=7 Tax=Turicibacter sanguinis TaxID=154288 RepID=A0A9X4XF09_9FIRM|nr:MULTISPECIES: Na/Pi cotransporter family protein [Turicibacter]EFF64081.1 Na/Pi-cotransporter II-like protein [Turicibacter sanguinis PC909]EGC91987.1 Na/Pi-cotransporter II-like protein [Turicibacter sp. HGF1]MBP3905353.1 Na/Pi cotransporter family protein [Turicibacter sp.]MCU7192074.1 Na/Pi cotransporter family protein [Turicibacter sanguinis]MCU7197296.1 Na/Pi cotransporter family protein [Turicibacter sanguinis]